MAAALTRHALRDELHAQQEAFLRAVEEMGARVQREVRDQLRRCVGGRERAGSSGSKEGGPTGEDAEAEAPTADAAEGAAPSPGGARPAVGLGLAARPRAAVPGRLTSLGWTSSSPAASPRSGAQDVGPSPTAATPLPGQAEEPATPLPTAATALPSPTAATPLPGGPRRASVGMGEDWGETFPNDLRLPRLLKGTRSRDGRRVSVGSRRGSLSSTSSGTTNDSKHYQGSLVGGGVLPVPMSSRRPSFLSMRLGMEDLVLRERDPIRRIVYHPLFDFMVVVMIVLNGFLIGVQTDVMARNVSEDVPLILRIFEIFFCAVFVVELLLRFIVERKGFFRGPERGWNVFDLVVVVLQLIEELLGIVAGITGTENHAAQKNLGFVRMLRALRLVRIIRIVRILRLIGELRTIVMSIASSMRHLFWTLMLLLMMIYMLSVPLTQIVLDYRLANAELDLTDLAHCWDSIGRSALTLFEAIFGGIDWDNAVMPLVDYVHLLLAPMFCLYIAFALLALMNVVTGVFVESAIDSANRDKEKYLVHIARELFEKADPNNTGVITWCEFQKQLHNPELQQYFKCMGVDAVSARSLFRILDLDNSGAIDADELLTGTLRLRGDAKAIDLAALIYESRRMSRRFQAHASSMDDALSRLGGMISQVSPGAEAAWDGPKVLQSPSSAASP